MDGELIRVDGELLGRWSWYVSAQGRDRCSDRRAVDWASYTEVLQASSRIMDSIANKVTNIIKARAVHLPELVAENVRDSKCVL